MMKTTTMAELSEICKVWNGDAEAFANIVGSYLKLSGMNQRMLADEFEAAVSTVSRWASGKVKPRPLMQKLIVNWIGKRAARAAEPSTAGSSSMPAFRIAAKGS
ncbi:MAG: hypothetical protein AB7P03_27645 [Kofleriaceae bacterium]